MNNSKHKEVPPDKLRWQCDPNSLGFKTTDELKSTECIIGQERALKAIKLGLEVKSPGYNIYAAGLTGTGKSSTIKLILEQIDTKGPIPDDIFYVNNFSHPDMPKVLQLPAGKGVSFADDIDDLINSLRKALPKIFESKKYKKRSKEVLADIEKHIKNLYEHLEEKFSKEGFAMVEVQMGTMTVPELCPVVKDKEIPFDKLQSSVAKGEISKEELKKIKEKHEALVEEMENAARESRKIERKMQNAVSDLKRQFCSPVVKDLINELKERCPNEAIGKYLDDVEDNILQNLGRFKGEEEKRTSGLYAWNANTKS